MAPKQRKPAGIIATSIAVIGLTLFIGVSFVAVPLLALLVGMALGYVFELFTGNYLVQAFNALGMTNVQTGDLPKVFGLLVLIAVMFRGNISKGKES
ncbi:hypothetical protein [Lysinibacillus capsici]|uniref:hypothetical protein n=1 Tax=Lysinibacillus capsici TaxID=2115968 RepID=UPI000E201140|nr:hypothetical protein [Lysinibacillus capsici]RDV27753.1 hypothetical protein C7B89_19420 [Lysinibacillus capsici]